MEQHPTTWRVGNVKISKVVEMELAGAPSDMILKGLTPAEVQAVPWLQPYFATPEGAMNLTIQAFVVESEGKKIIVDTCVGNDKKRDFPPWNDMNGPFLTDLAAAGFTRESITTVLCTHLHVDHVGWNTMLVDGKWVPTFTEARYLMGRTEFDHWKHEAEHGDPNDSHGDLNRAVFADSISPVFDAGLVDLVASDHLICDEIRLVPTPGHTPGHVSIMISSKGEGAMITGDLAHHPCQLAHPDWAASFDSDQAQSTRTREETFAARAEDGMLVIGTHWAGVTAGRIIRDGAAYRLAF